MTRKEIQEILDEMYEVKPENLNDKAKKLFYAFMSIADERDKYKQANKKAIEYIENLSVGEKRDLLEILGC